MDKMGKKAKNMNLIQNFYVEKRKSVTLTLSQAQVRIVLNEIINQNL